MGQRTRRNADEIIAKRIPQRYAIIGPRNWSFCCQLFLNAGRNKPQGATMKLPDILIVLRLRMVRVSAARVATYYNIIIFHYRVCAGRPWSLCTWLKDTWPNSSQLWPVMLIRFLSLQPSTAWSMREALEPYRGSLYFFGDLQNPDVVTVMDFRWFSAPQAAWDEILLVTSGKNRSM